MATTKGKKWSPAQLAKFRKTMAAKKAQAATTSIPLDAVPPRPAKAPAAAAAAVKRPVPPASNQQLLHDVVRLLLAIIQR